jgi:hypothetical protein
VTLPERNDLQGIAKAWEQAQQADELTPDLAEILIMLCDDPDDLARVLRERSRDRN